MINLSQRYGGTKDTVLGDLERVLHRGQQMAATLSTSLAFKNQPSEDQHFKASFLK